MPLPHDKAAGFIMYICLKFSTSLSVLSYLKSSGNMYVFGQKLYSGY